MLNDDRQALRELAHKSRDAKERERLRALYILSMGESVEKVASYFCVEESTLYRWIEKWKEERNLSDKPKEGRPPSFSNEEKEELKKLIKENSPKEHGINANCWDTKELQKYFLKSGKSVSQECIRACLKSMGAHYVKANLKYAEADRRRQEEFAVQFLKDIKGKPNSAVLMFQDEMSAGCAPKKGYGWTFEKRLVIGASAKRQPRLNCFGAVEPLKGEVIEMSSKSSKSGAFVRFLKKICKKHPKKRIWLYLDNLKVHKSAKVKGFLQKHKRLELKFLPPYSPEMNPQEQWWNYKRKKLLNNCTFGSAHKLALAMGRFAHNTPAEEVQSICSLDCIYSFLP